MPDARLLGGADEIAMQHDLLGISRRHQVHFVDSNER
jgi:hypothetical protein